MQLVDYDRTLEIYHQVLDFNEVLGNNLRGGNVISLDSIVYPIENSRESVVRYSFNGNQYDRVTYNSYEFGDLVMAFGEEYEYQTTLEAINYFEVDMNTGQEIFDGRTEIEYDVDGRLSMYTTYSRSGNDLTPGLRYEFDYFRNFLFRIVVSQYDSMTDEFIPMSRYVYDRVRGGEFNGVEMDTFDRTNSAFGLRGFAEYEKIDNQIKEQFFYYNPQLDEYEQAISLEYVLNPFSESLESREIETSSYRWKTEFTYDLDDQLAAKVEEFDPGSSESDQKRMDYSYNFNIPQPDLILPPGLAGDFYDGRIGIGLSFDPQIFHHKLDYIRVWKLDSNNMVHFDGIIDYFWSDDALTSTTNTKLETIEIFPNPSSDIINLVLEDQQVYNLEVYDVFGNQMEYKEVVGSTVLQVADWPSGAYILRAQGPDGSTLQSRYIKK